MAVIEVYDTLSLDGLCYESLGAITASLEIVQEFDRVMRENPTHAMSRVEHVRAVRMVTLQECGQMQRYYEPHTDKTLAPRHRACRKIINAAVDRLIDYEIDTTQDEDNPAIVGLVQELCEFVHTLYTALRTDNARKRNKLAKEYASV